MAKQLELYGDVSIEGPDRPKKSRWEEYPAFWREAVLSTKEEHICSRCEALIPKNSRADVTVDFDGSKPTKDDFKKLKYWHPDRKCPEPQSSDEPNL